MNDTDRRDTMNAEMIDLYRKVQKYRGEWQLYDPCYHKEYGYGTVDLVTDGEVLHVNFPSTLCGHILPKDDPDLLWLPPVYSDNNRCLWAIARRGGFMEIRHLDTDQVFIGINTARGKALVNLGAATLPEALLRAIASHE